MAALLPDATDVTSGYYLAKGLFTKEECAVLREHYMELRKEGRPGDFSGVDLNSEDPLKRFPRMIHMHHWDERSLAWGLDARLKGILDAMLQDEALLVQTMLYFKPPGARGQALHQDQFYLRAQPGTCMAAWLALDPCDEENGCMQIVPGTQDLPVLCTVDADTTISFTPDTVALPDGLQAIPAIMDEGDVLFFNGSIVHGSLANTSKTRFRRALIGHYITASSTQLSTYYRPIHRFDGTTVEDMEAAPSGGPCGLFVDVDGQPVLTMNEAGDGRFAKPE